MSVRAFLRALMGPVTSSRNTDPEGLKAEIAPATFWDGVLHGRIDYAASWYNWGNHSPYMMQDAFFLLCGAIVSLLCLPAIVMRLLVALSKGAWNAVQETLSDLKEALHIAVMGLLRGGATLPIACVRDSLKWGMMQWHNSHHRQEKKAAILVVDVQNDFFPGGALAVNEASSILPVLKNLIAHKRKEVRYMASQDWHPQNHGSFAPNLDVVAFSESLLNGVSQVAWPVHCVQGTYGAEFVKELPTPEIVIQKGQDPRNDSYSAVADHGNIETKLLSHLKAEGITRLFVCGVATDYCVGATVGDLADRGFEVIVIEDACRGVYAGLMGDAKERAYQETKAALEARGAHFMSSSQAMRGYPEQFVL